MASKADPKRRDYSKLGSFLRGARKRLREEETSRTLSVGEMATLLVVTKGFVYQVEQGKRKPRYGKLAQWASVYGVSLVELHKCLGQIPMDLVGSLKREPEGAPAVRFSGLTDEEECELLPFLEFVRWKIGNKKQGRLSAMDTLESDIKATDQRRGG